MNTTGIPTNTLARRLAMNTAVNFAGQAVLVVVGFVSTPYIVTHLGATMYGVLALLFAYIEAFALVDLGLNTSLIKYLAEVLPQHRPSEISAYLGTALTLFISAGLAIGVSVVTLAPWLAGHALGVEPELYSSVLFGFWVASAAFFVRFVGQAFAAVPIAAQRFDITNYINIGTELLRVGGAVLVLSVGYRLEGVIVVNLAANLLSLVANLIAAHRLLPAGSIRARFSAPHCRAILHFSKFMVVANVSGRVVHSLDKVILGNFLPVASVGFYTIAYSLGQKLWMLVGCITTVVFPAASALSHGSSAHRLKELYIRSSKLVAALAAFPAFALWLFRHELLQFWIGPDFASHSAPALGFLSWAFLAHSLAHIPYVVSQATGQPQIAARFAAVSAASNIVLLSVLVPKFGIAGAAVAFLTVQLVLTPWFIHTVNRMLGINWSTFIVRSYWPAAVACAAGGGACWLLGSLAVSLTSLAIVICVSVVVYALAIALVVLDAHERAACRAALARVPSLTAIG